MLQNSHYARIPFDEKLSERILDDYLNDLDPVHLYFTQADIDGFEKKYGRRLHEFLIRGHCMEPAREIYKLYRELHDAFGTESWEGNLQPIMKRLLDIRNRVRH